MHFKHRDIVVRVATNMVVVVFLAPQTLFAATATTTVLHPDTSVRGVCLRLTTLQDGLRQKITAAGVVYAGGATARANKIRTQALKRAVDDAQVRKDADARLAAYMSELRAGAHTDEERAAVATFETKVTTALLERRNAIDGAQKTFIDGVQGLLTTRVATVAGDAQSLEQDLGVAFENAKKDCDQGGDPRQVRDTLHAALGAIDLHYKAAFADQSAFLGGLSGLTEARRSAVLEASARFAAALDSASQELRSMVH